MPVGELTDEQRGAILSGLREITRDPLSELLRAREAAAALEVAQPPRTIGDRDLELAQAMIAQRSQRFSQQRAAEAGTAREAQALLDPPAMDPGTFLRSGPGQAAALSEFQRYDAATPGAQLAPIPTLKEKAKSALNRFAQAAVQVPSAVIKLPALIPAWRQGAIDYLAGEILYEDTLREYSKHGLRVPTREDQRKMLANLIGEDAMAEAARPIGERAREAHGRTMARIGGDGRDKDLEDYVAYRIGQAIDRWAEREFPADERLQGDFWWDVVPQAAGSTLGFMGAGGVAGAVRIPAAVAAALSGASVGAVGQYEAARQAGASHQAALHAAGLGAFVGTSEAAPISRIFERFNKASGGRLSQRLGEIARSGFAGTVEEATQEMFQSTADNAIAQSIYDKERQLLDGLWESGAAGGLVGGIMSAVLTAVGGFRRRGIDEAESEPGGLKPEPPITIEAQETTPPPTKGLKPIPLAPEVEREMEGLELPGAGPPGPLRGDRPPSGPPVLKPIPLAPEARKAPPAAETARATRPPEGTPGPVPESSQVGATPPVPSQPAATIRPPGEPWEELLSGILPRYFEAPDGPGVRESAADLLGEDTVQELVSRYRVGPTTEVGRAAWKDLQEAVVSGIPEIDLRDGLSPEQYQRLGWELGQAAVQRAEDEGRPVAQVWELGQAAVQRAEPTTGAEVSEPPPAPTEQGGPVPEGLTEEEFAQRRKKLREDWERQPTQQPPLTQKPAAASAPAAPVIQEKPPATPKVADATPKVASEPAGRRSIEDPGPGEPWWKRLRAPVIQEKPPATPKVADATPKVASEPAGRRSIEDPGPGEPWWKRLRAMEEQLGKNEFLMWQRKPGGPYEVHGRGWADWVGNRGGSPVYDQRLEGIKGIRAKWSEVSLDKVQDVIDRMKKDKNGTAVLVPPLPTSEAIPPEAAPAETPAELDITKVDVAKVDRAVLERLGIDIVGAIRREQEGIFDRLQEEEALADLRDKWAVKPWIKTQKWLHRMLSEGGETLEGFTERFGDRWAQVLDDIRSRFWRIFLEKEYGGRMPGAAVTPSPEPEARQSGIMESGGPTDERPATPSESTPGSDTGTDGGEDPGEPVVATGPKAPAGPPAGRVPGPSAGGGARSAADDQRGDGPAGSRADAPAGGQRRPGRGSGQAAAVPGERGRGEGEPADGPGEPADQPVAPDEADEAEPETPRNDYHFDKDTVLHPRGVKTRIRNNIRAIEIAQDIEATGREATAEEREILARFVGWGGEQRAVFDYANSQFKELEPERVRLRELLSDDEWDTARKSTINALYTSPLIVHHMWEAVRRMGFRGGMVLEPAVGVGHFIGGQPVDLHARSRWVAVDLDHLSAVIARALYPEQHIVQSPYEEASLPHGALDVIISNVPFGDIKITDTDMPRAYTRRVHDYFFVKSVQVAKPGGIISFITSHGTMDKGESTVRKRIAEDADFLGAVRLNESSLPGTKVIADIIFLRKRFAPPVEKEFLARHPDYQPPKWLGTKKITVPGDKDGDPDVAREINEYFVDNPAQVLGTVRSGSLYGKGRGVSDITVIAPEGQDLDADLAEAMAALPAGIVEPDALTTRRPKRTELLPKKGGDDRVGTYKLEDGELLFVERGVRRNVGEELRQSAGKGTKQLLDRITRLVQIRDLAVELLHAEAQGGPEVVQLMGALNRAYDEYVKRHKAMHEAATVKALADDPYTLGVVQALEDFDRESKTGTKREIFRTVVVPSKYEPTASTVKDALIASLNVHANVNAEFMAGLLNRSVEEVTTELLATGAVFRDPSGVIVLADEYLSGDVRAKLKAAQAAAKLDEQFAGNVQALETVVPTELGPAEITVPMGASWMPEEIPRKFAEELLGGGYQTQGSIKVHKVVETGRWKVAVKSDYVRGLQTYRDWSTEKRQFWRILEDVLNGKDGVATSGGQTDAAATQAAEDVMARLRDEWASWIWKDPDRTIRLVGLYNDTFNALVPRTYDGSWLELPGLNPMVRAKLRPFQLAAIARIILNANVLAFHPAGSGKTWEIIIGAMELRRLGLSPRNIIVVQKSTLGQFVATARELYPGAQINWTDNVSERTRAKVLARLMSDPTVDLTIVTHDHFVRMPNSKEDVKTYFEERLREIEEAIEDAEQNPDDVEEQGYRSRRKKSDNKRLKDLIKAQESLRAAMAKNLRRIAKDTGPFFSELGVTGLFYDESQRAKNLMFFTQLTRLKGLGSSTGSTRAMDLHVKAQRIARQQGERGLYFFSGTPIANSVLEMYHLFRYLIPNTVRALNIHHVDNWIKQFGEVSSEVEPTVSGGYKVYTRLRRFHNVPELLRLFWTFTDIVKPVDMDEEMKDVLPVVAKNAAGQRTWEPIKAEMPEGMAEFMLNVRKLAAWIQEHPKDAKEKGINFLQITTMMRKAALDMRLVNPRLPRNAGSKLSLLADNVQRIYRAYDAEKGAQAVFMLQGVPDKVAAAAGFPILYEELRAELVRRGIPAGEIAFIQDYNDKTKPALFNAINEGEIRVIIGGFEQLGVGVNIQKRLVALHAAEPVWRPDYFEQGERRAKRQGNTFKEVLFYSYVTDGSSDEMMYANLARKRASQEQLLFGDLSMREYDEDAHRESFTFGEISAVASRNPVILEQMAQRIKVDKMERQRANFERGKGSAQHALAKFMTAETVHQAQLADAIAEAEKVLPKEDKFSVTIEGKTYTKHAAAAQALGDFYSRQDHKQLQAEAERSRSGYAFSPVPDLKVRGLQVMMVATSRRTVVEFALDVKHWRATAPMGELEKVLQFLFADAKRIAELPGKIEASLEKVRSEIDYYRAKAQAVWGKEEELAAEQEKLSELTLAVRAAGTSDEDHASRQKLIKGFDPEAFLDSIPTKARKEKIDEGSTDLEELEEGEQREEEALPEEGPDDDAPAGGAAKGKRLKKPREQWLPPDAQEFLEQYNPDSPSFGMGAMFNWPDPRGKWKRTVDAIRDKLLNTEPGTRRDYWTRSLGRGLFDEWFGLDPRVSTLAMQTHGRRRLGEFDAEAWVKKYDALLAEQSEAFLRRRTQDALAEGRDPAEVEKETKAWNEEFAKALADVADETEPIESLERFGAVKYFRDLRREITRLTRELLRYPTEYRAAFGLTNIDEVIRRRMAGPGTYLRRVFRPKTLHPEWNMAVDEAGRVKQVRRLPSIIGGQFKIRASDKNTDQETWFLRHIDGTWTAYSDEFGAYEALHAERAKHAEEYGLSVEDRIKVKTPFEKELLAAVEAEERFPRLVDPWGREVVVELEYVDDVRERIASTLRTLNHNIAMMRLYEGIDDLQAVEGDPDDPKTPPIPGYVRLMDTVTLGPLAGKWVPEETAYLLLKTDTVNTRLYNQVWQLLNYVFKSKLTFLNLKTWMNNYLGLQVNAYFDGTSNPILHPEYLVLAAQHLHRKSKLWRRLVEENRLSVGFGDQEFKLFNRIFSDPAIDLPVKLMEFSSKVHRFNSSLGRAYDWGDQLYIMASYLHKRYSLKQSHRTAVKNLWMYPNYATVGKYARWLRKSPVGSTFISFMDTMSKVYLRALRERPVELMGLLALPGLITAFSVWALGVDDDELELLNQDPRRGGVFARYFQPLIPWRDKQNRLQSIDLRWKMPLADMLTVVSDHGGVGLPFILNTPLTEAAVELMANVDLFTGRPIADRKAHPAVQFAQHLANATEFAVPIPPMVSPGFVRVFDSLMNGSEGQFAVVVAKEIFGLGVTRPMIRKYDVLQLGKEKLRAEEYASLRNILDLYNQDYRSEFASPIGGTDVVRAVRSEERSERLRYEIEQSDDRRVRGLLDLILREIREEPD